VARFTVDPVRSRLLIDGRSTMHAIHTEARTMSGWVDLDVEGGGAVAARATGGGQVAIRVDELETGNAIYDREMRRRLDARRHPLITGQLDALAAIGRDGRYRIQGEIAFRGVARRYEDEMTIGLLDAVTVCLEGSRVFDVRDFGLEPPSILAIRVYPEVTVRASVVATMDR
jgi:polyisoprenoid-binding protein YceI